MSLDTVVEDVREEARARAEEIREEARADAEEIREEARADAEAIIEEAETEVEREIERERDQKLSSANLEAKQERLEARRDQLRSVREDVEARIADISGERRRELTAALLDSAATEFEDEDVDDIEVYSLDEDRELIQDLLTAYPGFSYAGEHDCLGGVVVESEASRLRVNNTFDSVLEDIWETNLKEISERLFEE
ncbi:MAG: V-type ATP synthase subunit E [Halobacteriales archaeon]